MDQENRTAWINEKVNLAKAQFMDGINIDIEQVVAEGSPEYHALTALVKETTEAFHREIPGSQVIGSSAVVDNNILLAVFQCYPVSRSHLMLPGRQTVSTRDAMITLTSPTHVTCCLSCPTMNKVRSRENAQPGQMPRSLRR